MVELTPVPFDVLIGRVAREFETKRSIFDLPAQRFVAGYPGRDLSVAFRERRASTPFGPAAGPHTQMAQNIALSWLAGGRVIELKTVQENDAISVPRPCIDMTTVGLNVEWSQELRVAQSLEEYVKGAMLIEILKAMGLGAGLPDTVLDMSVGYDLAGIKSAKVGGFLSGMLDATALIDRLRNEIPAPWARFRDLPFPTRFSDTLTLSTFHGCPPGEIEAIVEHLMGEVGLDVVVKLNPTLIGREGLDAILIDRLGYENLIVPDRAIAADAKWDEIVDLIGRLETFATRRGRTLGVKFSNTLVVENTNPFFPASEPVMYLSGPPLHPLAMALVARFRAVFGDRLPVSFSGGIDEGNFADAVGLGLKPVTVCSDFLRPGGYRRGRRFFDGLVKRMDAAGARDIDVFTLNAHGEAEAALASLGLRPERVAACRAALAQGGDPRAAAGDAFAAWVSAARVSSSAAYAERVLADPRYHATQNATPPKKIGSRLALFDCLTCDKCIPVCPNDANFSFSLPVGETPVERLTPHDGGWTVEIAGAVKITKPRQIGAFADVCNECGHCDVLCPEDGGPYKTKPLFFGGLAAFEAALDRDGFVVEAGADGAVMHGRFAGETVRVERGADRVRFSGPGFDLTLDPADVAASVSGSAAGPVDLTRLRIMLPILEAVADAGAANYVGARLEQSRSQPGGGGPAR